MKSTLSSQNQRRWGMDNALLREIEPLVAQSMYTLELDRDEATKRVIRVIESKKIIDSVANTEFMKAVLIDTIMEMPSDEIIAYASLTNKLKERLSNKRKP